MLERILVVEDSAAMRAYIRAALELAGYTDVTEAGSGIEALRLLPRGGFSLILVDINLPGLSGLELVAFLRRSASYRAVPVLVVTTEGKDTDRQRALSLGANGYLLKPFTPAGLLASIRALPDAGAAGTD